MQSRRPQQESEGQHNGEQGGDSSSWQPLLPHPPDLHSETSRRTRGVDNRHNVVIDIEFGDSTIRNSPDTTSIPIPSQPSHTEQNASNLAAENITSFPSAFSAVEVSEGSPSTSAAPEPQLPNGVPAVVGSIDENGNASDASSDDSAGTNTNR